MNKNSLLASLLLPILFAILALMFVGASYLVNESLEDIAEDAKLDLNELVEVFNLVEDIDVDDVNEGVLSLEKLFTTLGKAKLEDKILINSEKIPNLLFGETSFTLNPSAISEIELGHESNITIFAKNVENFTRVSTNFRDVSGKSRNYTDLDKDTRAYKQLITGRPFHGVTRQDDIFYVSAYKPIFDISKNLIGAFEFSKELDVESLSHAISQWRFLDAGFMAVTDKESNIVFHSKHVNITQAHEIINNKNSSWKVFSEHLPNWRVNVHMVYSRQEAVKSIFNKLTPVLIVTLFTLLFLGLLLRNQFYKHVISPIGGEPKKANDLLYAIQNGDLENQDEHAPEGTIIHNILTMRQQVWSMVNDIKDKNQELRISANVFDNVNDGICIVDDDFSILKINSTFTKITGYSLKDCIGYPLANFGFGSLLEKHKTSKLSFLDNSSEEILTDVYETKNGQSIFLHLEVLTAVESQINNSFICVISDVTVQQTHQQALEKLAYFDTLTSLPNRTQFSALFNDLVLSCQPSQGVELIVCFLDFDNFKTINDTYGHHIGDAVLTEIANRLRLSLRAGDLVARIGGDEFALVLSKQKADNAEDLVSQVLNHVSAEPYLIDGYSFSLKCSIGFTSYPKDFNEADVLLRHADYAMYEAKSKGGNQFTEFDTSLDSVHKHKYQLQNEISQGLKKNEFCLYYQPKAEIVSDDVIGFEALIRWNHPKLGFLTPDNFIDAIEDSTAIIELGNWVLENALMQIASWQKDNKHCKVAVNIAAVHFENKYFVDDLKKLLDKYPSVSPEQLEIEITESAAIKDFDLLAKIIEAASSIGVTFALDDFGIGHSSMNHIRNLPIHTIKIDKSFVQGMLNNKADYAVVNSVILMAKIFNKLVVAEGVETSEHLEALKKLGCALYQGYLLAKPMPEIDAINWLISKKELPKVRDEAAAEIK